MKQLKRLRFKCKNSELGCTALDNLSGSPYDVALEHMTKCFFEFYFCPNECREKSGVHLKLLGKDLKGHIDECENQLLNCDICDFEIALKDFEAHDCFKALSSELASESSDFLATKRNYGLNLEEIDCRCERDHLMQRQRGPRRNSPLS
mmetsp:Transcript_14560/g.24849  ORF Transcript_14560/g.24849 Transcript_14560/m.24849 type:complete len:149 (-) Transcript_14560:831-1277(-)